MKYHVVVYDIRDIDSDRPDSAAGEFNTEREARYCVDDYLNNYQTIYKWMIELHENDNVTILSQGERHV